MRYPFGQANSRPNSKLGSALACDPGDDVHLPKE